MTDRPIRVLIVDDHALFRAGLRSLLEAEPAFFRVVAEAESGFGVVGIVQQSRPDVLLLDLALPGIGGMDVLRELAGLTTRVKCVVLTAAISDEAIVEALRLGAVGVLVKTVATELLFKCVRSVVAGQDRVGRTGDHFAAGRPHGLASSGPIAIASFWADRSRARSGAPRGPGLFESRSQPQTQDQRRHREAPSE